MADNYFENVKVHDNPTKILVLNGNSLTTGELYDCARGLYTLELSESAIIKVNKARNYVERLIDENQNVYGLTTGFGKFANVRIGAEKVKELQENLIRSHCCGVGSCLSPYRVRMLLALRINVLAKGHSGIRLSVLKQMVDAFNAFCVPFVPEKGSVGCSGDLAPLAHMTLGLMGEGKMWSPETGWGQAADILSHHSLKRLKLGAKEGIAMINGTQMVSTLGAEAVERASYAALQADLISALSFYLLKGPQSALEERIQRSRPHKGKMEVAKRLLYLLNIEAKPKSNDLNHETDQNAYALTCIPQVHGVAHETIAFVKRVITTEINSASDNPLIFEEEEQVLSCGNFHGEYPGKVLDYLAIGISNLGHYSERRIDLLLNLLEKTSNAKGYEFSSFRLAQTTAAALVSENKMLCHPSTADSIPTSGGQEDHVSMGAFAARKVLQVLDHVEQIIATELLVACHVVDLLRLHSQLPNLLKDIHNFLRAVAQSLQQNRYLTADIEKSTILLQKRLLWDSIKSHLIDSCDDNSLLDNNGKV